MCGVGKCSLLVLLSVFSPFLAVAQSNRRLTCKEIMHDCNNCTATTELIGECGIVSCSACKLENSLSKADGKTTKGTCELVRSFCSCGPLELAKCGPQFYDSLGKPIIERIKAESGQSCKCYTACKMCQHAGSFETLCSLCLE